MSWISGLAGKAENLLNQIDQNAATALQKEKRDLKFIQKKEHLFVVTSASNNIDTSRSKYSNSTMVSPAKSVPRVRTPTNLSGKNQDDHLIQYLNNAAAVDIEPLEVETKNEMAKMNSNSSSAQNGVTNSEIQPASSITDVQNENQMLKNELRSLSNEMDLLLHRTKVAETDAMRYQSNWNEAKLRINMLESQIQTLHQQLTASSEAASALQIENKRLMELGQASCIAENSELIEMKNVFAKMQKEASETKASLEAELAASCQRLAAAESDRVRLEREVAARAQEAVGLSAMLEGAQTEWAHYKVRAQRTLAAKEALIAELSQPTSQASPSDVELQHLREEQAALSNELEQLEQRLEVARSHALDAEQRTEAVMEQAASMERELKEALAEERDRRQVAQQDCVAHAEKLHSVREDLSSETIQLAGRLREREAELICLRMELSQRPVSPPPSPPELQARLSVLTDTLYHKQATIEKLNADRNALAVQIENMELKHREVVGVLHQGRALSVNDTDDAKAQVPTFLLESPFDTGVTRRVKRAYSCLDAISIRTGVFLRRYPLARTSLFSYIII